MKTMQQWDREQTRKSYAEFLRLKLLHTGHAETHFLQFIYNKAEKTVMVRSAKAEFVLTCAEFKAHMWQLFMAEIPENLPFLFGKLERKSFERTNTLPDYGPHTPTRAEAYADRLRQDKWDIRRNGDPSCWRLASY